MNLLFAILMSCSDVYYFGYGSNLDSAFLRERLKDGEWLEDGWHKSGSPIGPDPEDLGTYTLTDYEFGYSLDLETETAGNIVPKKDATVYGALYKVTEEQLKILDKDEDLGEDYQRVALRVQRFAHRALSEAPEEVDAQVYIAYPHRLTNRMNPDPQYVKLLVEAARKRQFSDAYIETYLNKEPAEACAR